MNLTEARADDPSIQQYIALFAACFPGASHYTAEYLRWLYRANPAGAVVGFDAWDGNTLAAHYACVPARLLIGGRDCRALLSLNTATHPSYQGKGLFTKLAAATYEHGKASGFDCVYGVANANSTPGFVRKLSFQLVRPLEAQVGLGRLAIDDIGAVCAKAGFLRPWSPAELQWRRASPANRVRITRLNSGHYGAAASTHRYGIQAWGEILVPEGGPPLDCESAPLGPRLFLGLLPGGRRPGSLYRDIPQRLRPSPLNLIYLDLRLGVEKLDVDRIFFSFLDFDAY